MDLEIVQRIAGIEQPGRDGFPSGVLDLCHLHCAYTTEVVILTTIVLGGRLGMCDGNTQLEFLKRTIEERGRIVQTSSLWFRNRSFFHRAAAVVLGGLITLLSGLTTPFISAGQSRDVVLFLGVTSTVVATFGAFWSPGESWLESSVTIGNLKALQNRLEFLSRAPSFEQHQEEIVSRIFEEYQAILADHNRRWQQLRRKGSGGQ